MSLSTLPQPNLDDLSWLDGGGEMGALIRAMDWSATPLGPLALWPQSLRTSVSLCLSSTFPILVAWGPEHIQLYNDAYRPICGAKHPSSMGEPFKVCWATALPVVGDAFDSASRGQGAYIHNQRMILDRYGYLEEAFMTFSFSPIRDESGGVGGIFHPITESTAQVLGARRTQSLRDLTSSLVGARSTAAIGAQIAAQSAQLAPDLPFLLFYQLEESDELGLLGSAGLSAHPALAPARTTLAASPWPFAQAARLRTMQQIDGIAPWFAGAPCGPYEISPDSAMVLPVSLPGQQAVFGFVVAGVSSHRPLDHDYRGFYERLNAVVDTAVGNVLAWEQEQRRAAALEKIDRAKTAFFSNVSHEFRTPLTLILGPLEDALADASADLPAVQRQRLELTRRNALRLLKLVNSLLDFSRIEAGRVQARYVPLDLAALTGELASVFESAMVKGGLTYRVEIDDPGQPVYVDRDMWEKIVFNLLSNAFKFTLEGSVTLRLRRHGQGVRLSVIDTGAGIPEAELGRVFERFHRIEGAPGRTYEGTGIGLALIQELAQLHGGRIAVTSTLGEGSCFVVELPFGHAHLAPDRIGAQALPDAEQRTGAAFVEEALRWLPDAPVPVAQPDVLAPARARILVADDNNDMRAYVQALLSAHYTVQGCADGEAAFAMALADPPDLLLSDVMMPRLDGFGLLAKVRANPALHDLPVILLSARAGEEARIEGLQAGADDYLVKPFAAAELLARVRHQVARAGARQRESTFRALVDAAPVMLWRADQSGMTTYVSARWYDYTGRTPEQDLGLGWLDNIHPDDLEQTGAQFQAAYTARRPFSLDYRLRGRDGAYRWVIDAGHPHTDAQGMPDGYVGTVIDVHERALLQDRFEQVARALLEKNRLQSEFLITLAHELRNPLAPIRTGLELMRMRPDGADNRTIHAMMQRQVSHMAHLVDDLLDVARLTEGKVTLQRAPVLLADVVHDALEISMPQVEAGAHALTVSLPDHAVLLDADRHRIAQVLSNLVNNAAKYTPRCGQIAVSAALETRLLAGQDSAGVVLSVVDNGIGIAPAVLAQVFEMYTQVHDSAAMAQGGLGVGLHLVQRLVHLHGGVVAAASTGSGQGSCFTVWLPLAAGGGVAPGEAAAALAPPTFAGLAVLVVDDNLDAADMLGELLQASGHRVVLAHDGAAALANAALHLPAVVFLDIGLPDMSGLDVAVALRKIDGMAGATLVALTGWGTQEDRARTLRAGFDLHLTKPAQFDSVDALLREVQARG
ncbi:ATP-binding protein [Massilia sp. S19_KUP03_FR1]|uniref:ATP-binding protein n=1 Tax=Massilia sp. S19_KUP03_FR1 TaxID=3025503 RepID=UPI002FCD7E6D